MTTATGVGSWPGTNVRQAVRAVRDLLADSGLPYCPETPARGPGADLIGRGASLLVDLPVDLQPMGWRLVDRPGRDLARAGAHHREDLDELGEAYDGYAGPLKVQLVGPWTLAASLWLPRGERALTDPGATRDLAQSLAAGLADRLARIEQLVPGASLVVQVDEPSLPAVLEGRLPTASGYGRVRAVDGSVVREVLAEHLEVARTAGGSTPRRTVVHCCAGDPPLPVLRQVGADALSLDVTALRNRTWEGIAVALEAGTALWAGALPTTSAGPDVAAIAQELARRWDELGLDPATLADLVVSPACGLASLTEQEALSRHRSAVELAERLADRAAG